ncbi:hypothetical protein Droror1_Dr00012861 [Drosera rotundifolia]
MNLSDIIDMALLQTCNLLHIQFERPSGVAPHIPRSFNPQSSTIMSQTLQLFTSIITPRRRQLKFSFNFPIKVQNRASSWGKAARVWSNHGNGAARTSESESDEEVGYGGKGKRK